MIKVGKNAYRLSRQSPRLRNDIKRQNVLEMCWKMCPWFVQSKTMSGISDESIKEVIKTQIPVGLNMKCRCGCNVCFNRPKGDKKIVEFLNEEIKTQFKRKDIISRTIPNFEGFEVENRKAEVILTKKFHNESLSIKINVNHSNDDDDDDDEEDDDDNFAFDVLGRKKYFSVEKLSRSNFCIEIQKDFKTLCFYCSIIPKLISGKELEYRMPFYINFCAMYEGKCTNSTYFMTKETGLDGYLHELLIHVLQERGVTFRLVEQLQDYCSVYRHVLYLEFLEKLKDFVIDPYS
ncbi:conserved regulator of innate immunity protein 3-like isoform X2 [Centruroides vittatus]|uniref:conserved regulator of innate immunity protein 3-like isoform X2 n=1 Tax=Centruroides vittatus TaxID=120091 RepID=UPI00351090E4